MPFRMKPNSGWWIAMLALGLVAGGCTNLEYKVREKFGQQKRELLVDRVGDAKDSQEAAKQEFVSALAQFKSVTGFTGGDLEKKYDDMKAEFDRCASRADDVHKRIGAVDDVAKAMFREWEGELGQYASTSLRQTSERQLQQTRQAYERLLAVMRAAASRMDPVLATFRDQVLFLKHNLNARAISSLGGVTGELQRDVDVLVADMERAIADANRFIETMQAPAAAT
jgi:uncharacterized protein YukE